MKKPFYTNFFKKLYRETKPSIVFVEEEDDITDEIEKSLWMIKRSMDLPTEEIDIAIMSRKNLKDGLK
tara:strand:+ start:225 stop:428 length:204 start_codon:yes stop_codon:yes gene_type:complete